jgi:hypothetical protein
LYRKKTSAVSVFINKMAAIQQNSVKTNVRSENISNTSTVTGDKAIAEAVVEGIVNKLGDNGKLSQLFSQISGPLTAEKGLIAL